MFGTCRRWQRKISLDLCCHSIDCMIVSMQAQSYIVAVVFNSEDWITAIL